MVKSSAAAQDPYYQELHTLLLAPVESKQQLYDLIVNAPFKNQLRALQIDLGVVVLLLANHQTKTIDRIALSDTYSAKGAVRMSAKPFEKIKIPLGHKTNIIARAIATGKPQQTEDWRYLFVPALTARQAHFNQAGAGIECSVVYPIKGKKEGAMIFSFYQPLSHIGSGHHDFMKYYASQLVPRLL